MNVQPKTPPRRQGWTPQGRNSRKRQHDPSAVVMTLFSKPRLLCARLAQLALERLNFPRILGSV
jgi:hypothetical protein